MDVQELTKIGKMRRKGEFLRDILGNPFRPYNSRPFEVFEQEAAGTDPAIAVEGFLLIANARANEHKP